MNLTKKVFLATSLFTLSLGACSSKAIPISNKNFSPTSFDEVQVDNGFYGGASGYIGANKDELLTKIKSSLLYADKLVVSDTTIVNLSYNSKEVAVYAVNERKNEGIGELTCYALEEGNDTYRFVKNKGSALIELEDYYIDLGYRSSSSTIGGVTTTTTYQANVSFGLFTYNNDSKSLTVSVEAKDTVTVNEETLTKKGTFTLTLEANQNER